MAGGLDIGPKTIDTYRQKSPAQDHRLERPDGFSKCHGFAKGTLESPKHRRKPQQLAPPHRRRR